MTARLCWLAHTCFPWVPCLVFCVWGYWELASWRLLPKRSVSTWKKTPYPSFVFFWFWGLDLDPGSHCILLWLWHNTVTLGLLLLNLESFFFFAFNIQHSDTSLVASSASREMNNIQFGVSWGGSITDPESWCAWYCFISKIAWLYCSISIPFFGGSCGSGSGLWIWTLVLNAFYSDFSTTLWFLACYC